MTKSIEAGSPKPAPSAAKVTATKQIRSTSKIMLLAIHQDAVGKMLITPLDIEHEEDDQTELSAEEIAAGLAAKEELDTNQPAVNNGLAALFNIFSGRLFRNRFRCDRSGSQRRLRSTGVGSALQRNPHF